MKTLHEAVIEAVQKLGILGTISYVGAMLLFICLFFVDFETESSKALTFALVGAALLFFSGLIYWLESKEETTKVKEGLGVLREVYNRMAERIADSDRDKTVSITMTIDNLPDKIAEVIKKTTSK